MRENSRRRLAYRPLIVPTVERAFPPRGDWSTTTEAVRLSMRSAAGFGYFGSLERTKAG